MRDAPAVTPSIDLLARLLDGLVGEGQHPVDDDLVASLEGWGEKYRRQQAACVREKTAAAIRIGKSDDLKDVGECACEDADHCLFVLNWREIIEHCGLSSVVGEASEPAHA